MSIRPAALFLLAIAGWGCNYVEPLEDEPFIVIAGPKDFRSFEVHDSGKAVLWRIESEGIVQLSRINFGAVPEGFRQTVPEDGSPPRELVPGEDLTTVTVTTTRIFTHWGFALGPAAWSISSSRMEIIDRSAGRDEPLATFR